MDKDRIKLDRMRYVKDNMPSNFAILAIVFDVLYFVLIYKINNEFFYNFLIGVSIIVNLLFMLFGFWSSIEVKNYHGKFGYFMIALGVVQIIRIFRNGQGHGRARNRFQKSRTETIKGKIFNVIVINIAICPHFDSEIYPGHFLRMKEQPY